MSPSPEADGKVRVTPSLAVPLSRAAAPVQPQRRPGGPARQQGQHPRRAPLRHRRVAVAGPPAAGPPARATRPGAAGGGRRRAVPAPQPAAGRGAVPPADGRCPARGEGPAAHPSLPWGQGATAGRQAAGSPSGSATGGPTSTSDRPGRRAVSPPGGRRRPARPRRRRGTRRSASVSRSGWTRSSSTELAWISWPRGSRRASCSASWKGWMRSTWWPMTRAGTSMAARWPTVGAMGPARMPWSTAAVSVGSLDSVFMTLSSGSVAGAGQPLEQRRRPADHRPGEVDGQQHGHEGDGRGRDRPLQHGHLDDQALHPFGGHGRHQQAHVPAQGHAAHHRLVDAQVVHQGAPRARRRCPCGGTRPAWASRRARGRAGRGGRPGNPRAARSVARRRFMLESMRIPCMNTSTRGPCPWIS